MACEPKHRMKEVEERLAAPEAADYKHQYSLLPDHNPEYGAPPGPLGKLTGGAIMAFTLAAPWLVVGGMLCSGVRVVAYIGAALLTWLLWRRLSSYRRTAQSVTPPFFPTAAYAGRPVMEVMYNVFTRGGAEGDEAYDVILPTLLGTARAVDFKTFILDIPMYRVISSHTQEFNKHLLEEKFYSYEKGTRFHDLFSDIFGSGIFNSDGRVWKEQRNAAAHLFTSWQLENTMLDVFQRRAEQVGAMLAAKAKAGAAFDLQAVMYCYTFDSIFEIAFGKAVNALGGVAEDVEFQQAFDTMQAIAASRFFSPEFVWKFKRFLRLGSEANMAKAVKTVRGYVQDVLESRRRQGVAYGAADLIAMYEQQNEEQGDEKKKVADADVIDFIINFTIAGRDTTASLMTSAFYMLSISDPSYRERVEAEIQTATDPKEMHFLQAVLQETLRMWPSVPVDLKVCVKGETLPCGERAEPGEALMYSHLLFNRNPANFKNPNTFDPDRWMAGDGTVVKYDPKGLAYPAFNGGPRICLGRHMAMMEAKVLMSTLMADYRIDVAPGFVPVHKFQIVLQMRGGLTVTATPRAA